MKTATACRSHPCADRRLAPLLPLKTDPGKGAAACAATLQDLVEGAVLTNDSFLPDIFNSFGTDSVLPGCLAEYKPYFLRSNLSASPCRVMRQLKDALSYISGRHEVRSCQCEDALALARKLLRLDSCVKRAVDLVRACPPWPSSYVRVCPALLSIAICFYPRMPLGVPQDQKLCVFGAKGPSCDRIRTSPNAATCNCLTSSRQWLARAIIPPACKTTWRKLQFYQQVLDRCDDHPPPATTAPPMDVSRPITYGYKMRTNAMLFILQVGGSLSREGGGGRGASGW